MTELSPEDMFRSPSHHSREDGISFLIAEKLAAKSGYLQLLETGKAAVFPGLYAPDAMALPDFWDVDSENDSDEDDYYGEYDYEDDEADDFFLDTFFF